MIRMEPGYGRLIAKEKLAAHARGTALTLSIQHLRNLYKRPPNSENTFWEYRRAANKVEQRFKVVIAFGVVVG